MIFGSLVFSNNFYKSLKIFHLFYSFFTNTHPGSKPKFGRAPELIRRGNKTSILFEDFECNRTSNLKVKHQLNQNIHVQHHRSGRGRAFSKTLQFVMATSGKPSTWFPPGTRRADNFLIALQMFSYLGSDSNFKSLGQIHFLIIF